MEFPLQILPIGGLGKIGMNCMLIGARDRWIMVDCGVQFPPVTLIGAERIIPDIAMIARWRDKIEAVVITHGHEDHIGALPWVLPVLDPAVPVFASRFTTRLIEHRLSEHNLWAPQRMHLYSPGERFQAGPFEIEPIRVTHSIPDCSSLAMRCEDGTILHTGDWKIDDEPMDGEHFDRAAFQRLGDEGVNLLLSDSTNIQTPGRTRSESEVARSLPQWVDGWPGRVIVTQFASNLHRMRALGDVARASGRQLVFCGRSLSRYYEAAVGSGRAPFPAGTAIDIEDAKGLDPARALIITTGSQGERRAALARAAEGNHRHLVVGTGDRVIHSARVIPGNEADVFEMFNQLSLRGADLVVGRHTGVHASGHACADELAEMLRLVRPGHFVPVHGEYTFLRGHAELAKACDVPQTTVLQNGERFGVRPGRTRGSVRDTARLEIELLDTLYNDGPVTADADDLHLKERRRIAWNGLILADITVRREPDGRLHGDARMQTRAMWDDGGALPGALAVVAERAVRGCPPRTPLKEVEEVVAASVRRAVRKATEKRPEVVVVLHMGRAH